MRFVILSEAKDLCIPARTHYAHPMRDRSYAVYMMTNRSRTLYVGMTNHLPTRVRQHKEHACEGSFTDRYQLDRLVWFEHYRYVRNAIAREKQIKGWLRLRKLQLIAEQNPTWRDLSEDWEKPIEPLQPKCIDPSLRSG